MRSVLFVCRDGAGCGPMAEAFVNHLADERGLPIRALSAGTEAANDIHPAARAVMLELGLEMTGQYPKRLTQEMADTADRVVVIGCGADPAACSVRLAAFENWGLDPWEDRPLQHVYDARNEIRRRVEALLKGIGTTL